MREFDLVVAGSGIIGATVATLAAINHPNLSIAVFDKSLIGSGATRYSGGLSTPLAKSAWGKNLYHLGNKAIKQLNQYIDLDHKITGALYVVGKNNLEKFFSLYCEDDLFTLENFSFKETSLSEVLTIPNDKIMLFSKNKAHYAYPYNIVEKMITYLRAQQKHKIFESSPVKNSTLLNNKLKITAGNDIEVIAKKLIITIGPWLHEKPELVNNYKQSKNKKVAALHVDIKPHCHDPAIVFFDEDAFLLPVKEKGHWLFSFTSTEWNVSPNSEISISSNDINTASHILSIYAHTLKEKLMGGRVFCDTYSENRELKIEIINKSTLVIDGASGSGYRFAYGIANQLVASL